ncbi:MAG: DUF2911 domain-containing protein [Bacteroidota bacterium]
MIFRLLMLVAILASGCSSKTDDNPQDSTPGNRKSPIAIASVKGDGTYVKVVYGQPFKNGRTVFGDLAPYGEVWRCGANEATEITITKPILVAGELVEQGTYAMFVIPEQEYWTLILNYGLGQWGAFEYNPSLDYKRIEVPITSTEQPVEAFTISFSELTYSLTTMTMAWDTVQAEIPVRFY